jgi:hypothetical protein
MTNAEVVCADGVDGVEAVVVRYAPTGRLSAVNASAFVSCDASSQSRRLRSKYENQLRSRKSSLKLSGEQIERLNNLAPAAGERHDERNMAAIDR